MSAIDTQTLAAEAKCFNCLGVSLAEGFGLALYSRIVDNAAPVVSANTLTLNDGINPPTVINNPIGAFNFTNGAWVTVTANVCPNLTSLNFTNNTALSTLTITTCATLKTLTVTNSQLATLNLSGMAAASTALVLTGNTLLFSVSSTSMTSLTGAFDLHNNVNLDSVSFPALTSVGGVFDLNSTTITSMTMTSLATITGNLNMSFIGTTLSVSFPALTTVGGFVGFSFSSGITDVSLPLLTSVGATLFDFNSCTALTTLNANSLQSVTGNIGFNSCTITSISLPALTTCVGDFTAEFMPNCTSISMPLLTSVAGNFFTDQCPSLVSMNISSLATISGLFNSTDCNSLAALDFTALTAVNGGSIVVENCPVLASVTVGAWPLPDPGTFDFFNCALDVTSVDDALVTADGAGLTGSTIDLSNGTSATPGAAGAAAKASLILAGNSVTTN